MSAAAWSALADDFKELSKYLFIMAAGLGGAGAAIALEWLAS